MGNLNARRKREARRASISLPGWGPSSREATTTFQLEESERCLPSPFQMGQNYRDHQQPFAANSQRLLGNRLCEQAKGSRSAAPHGGCAPEGPQQPAVSPLGDIARTALPHSAEVKEAKMPPTSLGGSHLFSEDLPQQQQNTSLPSAPTLCHHTQHTDICACLQQQMLWPM